MRTGADYRENVRHGRNVWLTGEGPMEDVTTHPAASAMVDEHVEWYDCHFYPEWGDVLLTWPDASGHQHTHSLALIPPKTSEDLRRLGKAISTVNFITGGNITHTPGYDALVALGMLNVLMV